MLDFENSYAIMPGESMEESGIVVWDRWSVGGNVQSCDVRADMTYCKDAIVDDDWTKVKQVQMFVILTGNYTYIFDICSYRKDPICMFTA